MWCTNNDHLEKVTETHCQVVVEHPEQRSRRRSTLPLRDAHEGNVTEKDEVVRRQRAREGQEAEEQRQSLSGWNSACNTANSGGRDSRRRPGNVGGSC